MALLLSCWLLLQAVALFGACMTRFFSPSSTLSCSALSKLPSELKGMALVLLTGEGSVLLLWPGSLAGIGLSEMGRTAEVVKVLYTGRNARALQRRAGATDAGTIVM